MRIPDLPRSANAATRPRLFLRRWLIWCHLIVGSVAFFIYLTTIDFTHFNYWSRGAGTALIFVGAPVLLPYLISAIRCWHLYTWQMDGPSRIRVAAFIVVLVVGAALVSAVRLGAFGNVDTMDFLSVLGLQAGAYLWAGEWLVNVV